VGAKAVVQVCRVRVVDEVRTSTTHYYLSSYAASAAVLAGFVRGHWGIVSMHWVLDVAFREDHSRVREKHAGTNLAMLRRVAVSLLRRAPGRKKGATTPTKREGRLG
jgi:predicted transposase YbfD/YdcC